MTRLDSDLLPSRRRRAPMVLALEPRMMFDGAAVATAADTVASAAAGAKAASSPDAAASPSPPAAAAPTEVRAADPARNDGRKEVAFIDTSVADYQKLVDGIKAGVEVELIDGGQSGLAQIAKWAETHSGYDAIHILSHGSEGVLTLGTDRIGGVEAASAPVQAELSDIGRSLTADGDILLYGCDLALGSDGRALVAALGAATGADVAASTDATGAGTKGGDWVLEARWGNVDSQIAYAPALGDDFQHLLTTISFSTGDNGTSTTISRNITAVDGTTAVLDFSNAGNWFAYTAVNGGTAEMFYGYTSDFANHEIVISVSGYTFDLTGFKYAVSDGLGSVTLQTYVAYASDPNTWVALTDSTLNAGTHNAAGSFSNLTTMNDVVKVRFTSTDDALNGMVWGMNDFDIQDVKPLPAPDDDFASAAEAGGVANGTGGGNASGNAVTNDGGGATVTSVRAGYFRGAGTAGTVGQPLAGLYGSLTLSADGSYTYVVDQNNAAVQALAAGQTLTEHFNYSHDGAAPSIARLTITITGANDAPTAVDDSGTATEKGGAANGSGGSNATGNVLTNDTDPDAGGSKTVSAVRTGSAEGSGSAGTVGQALAGTYGTLTLNADGSYTYVVDDNNAAVQALASGDTLVERFNYTLSDGSLADIAVLTITINGANDAPVAANDSGAATEAGGVANGTGGSNATGNVLTNDTDVDHASRTVTAVRTGGTEGAGAAGTVGAALVGTYGTLTLNADGTYTYVVDQNNSAVQALAAGGTLTESFNYTVSDGSLTDIAVLTITITGANDAPVAVDDSGAATEAGGVANGTGGSNATGNVLTNDTDGDAGATKTVTAVRTGGTEGAGTAGTVGVALVGTYGTLTLDANGNYTYVVDDNNAAVQALAAGATLTESFNYTNSDGSLTDIAVLTITITGANDAPAVSGLVTGTPYAENAIQAAPAQLFTAGTIADVDNANFNGGYLRISGSAAGDVLSVRNQGSGAGQIGISGSTITYQGVAIGTIDGAETGAAGLALKITLNANASATAVNALLQNVLLSTSDTPTASRTFTVTMNDGTASGTATSVVTIDAQNDAPTLGTTPASGGGAIYTEGGGAISPFAGTVIGTVEAGQSISQIVLTVSGLTDGASETLVIDGVDVALTNGTTGTTGANSITYAVSVTGGVATVTLTRSGDMTAAAAQGVVDGLAYKNSATGSGLTTGNRVVTLTAVKDTGGTANGGSDTRALNSAATLLVQRVNHAPTLTTTTSTPTHTEDGAATSLFSGTTVSIGSGDTGQSLSSLTLTVSNVTDGAHETLIVDGIAVSLTNGTTGTTTANGITYAVSLTGGTATVTLTRTGGMSAAQVQSLVDGLQYRNTSQDPTAATRAVTLTGLQDNGGTAGGGADTAMLSAQSNVTVVALNDAPTATATTTTQTLDSGAGATSALFSGAAIATIEAGQSISQITLTVSGLADGMAEKLTIDGVDVALTNGTSGTTSTNNIAYTVSVSGGVATVTLTRSGHMTATLAQSVVDGLAYKNTNASAAVTSGDRVVTLTAVRDSGGSANGGSDTRTLTLASTVSLRANDIPVVTPVVRSGSTLETIDLANAVSVSDSRGGATYEVTVSVGSGQLNLDLSGVTIGAGANDSTTVTFSGSKAQVNAALATLKYTPAAFGSQSIVVQVKDGGAAYIGGEKIGTGTVQITITQASANDGTPISVAPTPPPPPAREPPIVAPNPGGVGDLPTPPVITSSNLAGGLASASGLPVLAAVRGEAGSGLVTSVRDGGRGVGTQGAGLGITPVMSVAPPPFDTGFRPSVMASSVGVAVARPVGIVEAPSGRISFAVPADAFAVARPDAAVRLSATQADGRPLPAWMSFNPATGEFEGTPPPGVKAVDVKVIARDQNGHEAAQVIRFRVSPQAGGRGADAGDPRTGDPRDGKPAKAAFAGRPGLASQLAAARQGGGEHVGGVVRALARAADKVA